MSFNFSNQNLLIIIVLISIVIMFLTSDSICKNIETFKKSKSKSQPLPEKPPAESVNGIISKIDSIVSIIDNLVDSNNTNSPLSIVKQKFNLITTQFTNLNDRNPNGAKTILIKVTTNINNAYTQLNDVFYYKESQPLNIALMELETLVKALPATKALSLVDKNTIVSNIQPLSNKYGQIQNKIFNFKIVLDDIKKDIMEHVNYLKEYVDTRIKSRLLDKLKNEVNLEDINTYYFQDIRKTVLLLKDDIDNLL